MRRMKSILISIAEGGVFAALAVAQPTHYAVKDLGALPGATFSQANAVSDIGFVAGLSTINASPTSPEHAVLWYPWGSITDIGKPGLGGLNSEAFDVNDFGQVIGQAELPTTDPNNENFCGFSTGLECRAFLWQGGVMSPLPLLKGGVNGLTTGNINNFGQVPGTSENGIRDSACPAPQLFDFVPVIWGPAPGEIHSLLPLHGASLPPSVLKDTVGVVDWINDNGEAVGFTGSCANSVVFPLVAGPHAMLWEPDGSATDLGNIGSATVNVPLSINNQSQVVGAAGLTDNSTATYEIDAFLWTRETGMRDLHTLPGDATSGAISINDNGVIVGLSIDAAGNPRAFIWQNGAMTDLNTLVPADSPLYLLVAENINSSGEIAGFGVNSSGDVHGFLLTPDNGAFLPLELGAQKPTSLAKNTRQQIARWMATHRR